MKPEIVTYLSRDEETTIYAEKYVPEKAQAVNSAARAIRYLAVCTA